MLWSQGLWYPSIGNRRRMSLSWCCGGVTTHGDDGAIIEDVVLSRESGCYGVDISKGVESLELGSVMFEWEEGVVGGHGVI